MYKELRIDHLLKECAIIVSFPHEACCLLCASQLGEDYVFACRLQVSSRAKHQVSILILAHIKEI